MRYGDNVDIVSYITIFNEPANLLVGGTGAYFSYLHLGYGATALSLLFRAFRFYKLKHTDLYAMLVITLQFEERRGGEGGCGVCGVLSLSGANPFLKSDQIVMCPTSHG